MNTSRRNFIGKSVLAAMAGAAAFDLRASSTVLHSNGNHTISVSPDGEHWFESIVTPDDLAQATLNSGGQRELIMHTEVPDGDWSKIQVQSSGEIVGVFTGIGKPPSEIVCMVILVVIAVVVLGVIIYQMVEVCRKYLGPTSSHKDDKD